MYSFGLGRHILVAILMKSRNAFTSGSSRTNIIWSGIDFLVVPLAMLIATPVLIHVLGLEAFGVLILINALIGFTSVFNFGFGDTCLKYVSHHTSRGDRARGVEIVRTVGLIALGTGVVIGIGFASAVPMIGDVFKISTVPQANDALRVASVVMPLRLIESIYVATLRGCYRYDLAGYVTIVTKATNIVGQVALALAGYALPVLVLWTAAIVFLSIIGLATITCGTLGNITPKFTKNAFDEIFHFAKWSWLQGVAGLAYANVDRLLISAIIGPSALGVYGVCIQISQNLHNAISAGAHTMFPKISILQAQIVQNGGDREPLRRLYLTVSRKISVLSIMTACIISVFSFQIIDAWVGPTIAVRGHVVLSLMVISFSWFTSNHSVIYYTLNGIGRAKLQGIVAMTCASIMALGCFLLVPSFGLIGAALVRFLDIPIRFAVRVFVARNIIGGIPLTASLDFIRLTAIGLSVSYGVKAILMWAYNGNISLKTPSVLFILFVLVLAAPVCMLYIEGWIGARSQRAPT